MKRLQLKRLNLLSLLLFLAGLFAANAQDIKGGEVTWNCLKSGPDAGKYQFNLVLYYACSGSTTMPASQSIEVENGAFPAIVVNQLNDHDISLPCYDPSAAVSCANASAEAVSKVTYTSLPVTLNGVPPASGWVFTWSDCCRPTSTNLTAGQGMTLRSVMYPYQAQNANPCYDDSPRFTAEPFTVVCTDYLALFNHTAVDNDGDGLTSAFVDPLDDYTTWPASPVNYAATFSATAPFPGTSFNAGNLSGTIDPVSGEIEYLSYTDGNYAHAVKVTSFRNGIKTAEVIREYTVELVHCPPLPPPYSSIYNAPPSVHAVRNGSTLSNTLITAFEGDTVRFEIEGVDNDILPGFIPQTVKLEATGEQFGTLFSDPVNGCADAPCAMLDTSSSSKTFDPATGTWKNVGRVNTSFEWALTSDHASDTGRVHLFYFQFTDNYCPIPGMNFVTIAVKVYSADASLSGQVFDDANGNGIKDVGELGVPNALVHIQPFNFYYSTDSSGNYSVRLPYGNYTVASIIPNYHNVTLPASPGTYNVALSAVNDSVTAKDFGWFQVPGINDLAVSLTASNAFRPGNQVLHKITYRNEGTTTLSGSVQLTYDTSLTFISSTPAFVSHSGNVLDWSFSNLLPGTSGSIDAFLEVDSNATLGQGILSHVNITPLTGDTLPGNNADTLERIVLNSYDPNEKVVDPEGYVLPEKVKAGQVLTYTIHFQNTGNAPALQVVIVDTLESGLDLNTFKQLAASHTMEYEIVENYVRWTFNDINLPDSNANEPESHGFVKFSIQMNKGLQKGEEVANKAYIYFDLNDPIITSEVITRVDEPIGIIEEAVNSQNFTVFPNPASGNVSIQYELPPNAIAPQLKIYNISGQLERVYVLPVNLSKGEYTILQPDLQRGIYFISLSAEGMVDRVKRLVYLP